jgi:chemotaxis protein methyltransferase CheR
MGGFEEFLEEALPPLGLSPSAHRRRGIKRRLARRMESQGIHEFTRYLEFIRRTPGEARFLRALLPVTISRFFRNRQMWKVLAAGVLLPLATRGGEVMAWSAGCASGEEPYTLALTWRDLPGVRPPLSILATDVDSAVLERVGEGLYGGSSLKEAPPSLLSEYFVPEGSLFRLRKEVRRSVTFLRHDMAVEDPPGLFHLILCRNAAFTYFGEASRLDTARKIAAALLPGGHLVIGRTERLPREADALFAPAFPEQNIDRVITGR